MNMRRSAPRLVVRHGVREAELDQLLRGERFIDLYAVVRQGLRISKPSYSIKKLEHFYWGHIRNHNPEVADAMSSVIAYERWTRQPDDTTLGEIERYNQDDVISTLDLHSWLEVRRAELEGAHGPQPRPDQQPPAQERPLSDAELTEQALAERLEAAGEQLLAGLVRFHRREARPAYWEQFRLRDLDDEELQTDPLTLGPLTVPHEVGAIARSKLWRYEFPPQDSKIQTGDQVFDVTEHHRVGIVVDLDLAQGYVIIKKSGTAPVIAGLTAVDVVRADVMRAAVQRLANDRLAGHPSLGTALLDRVVPPVITDVPTTGKTREGAALVRALVDAGLRVGITANSHAVIAHFLSEVARPGVQKCDEDELCPAPDIAWAKDNGGVIAALGVGVKLVGGTAWLWSRPDLAGALDVLVIEEAGQFSLANAVAVSQAARSLVLLGDPQQLPQPLQAQHPHGAGTSALGHLLEGHDTIPADRGVFLPTTYRMHPQITGFISDLSYEGKLQPAPGLERRAVGSQSGLRRLEVAHTGCADASVAEAHAIRDMWQRLITREFTDRDGSRRPMTANDVLIVAPYNRQVGTIKALLPDTARVGTVDKFQGQQAPVVLYSMTSSSVEDAPRGVSFLYDTHRLNVAVSRAQALTVVVFNPQLLGAPVHSPEQLRQVNALCRYAELSRPW